MTRTRKLPPGAAFSTIAEKTGAGRKTTGEAKVPSVESVECDGLPVGPHELTNDRRGVTSCRWCGVDWATLDALVREAS